MKLEKLMYALYIFMSASFHFARSCPKKCTCHCDQLIAHCNNSNIANSELKDIAQGLPLNTAEIDLTSNLI